MIDAAQRNALKTSDFALPKERAYPMHDLAHAKDALSRVAQNGTPEERVKVRAAVHRRYPALAGGAGDGGDGHGGVHPNSVEPKRKPDPSALGSG